MSWRQAAELARTMAQAARDEADATGATDLEIAALQERLRAGDRNVLIAWLRRRKAQHLDEIAGQFDLRADNDVTVKVRGPKK